ncbi:MULTISPECIES: ABC transporter permease [unclassified Streptomyces]|uniref:ABC transporter permease n=1 Tax=unclassified Streptomyces TaxID=2593676 RepID=UPI0036E76F00
MMKMILWRSVYAIASLFVVSVVVFAATQALPGDAAVARLGKNATPAALESFRQLYHLNESLPTQYVHWLGNILQGRLGVSFATGFSVSSLIGHQVTDSLVLIAATTVVAIPVALALGILTAIRRDRATDHVSSAVMLVISALPEFVLGVALVVVLATNVLHVLPAVSPVDPEHSIFQQLDLLVLPTLTLVLLVLPYVMRTVRACMIEALDSEYVTMARLKGMSELRVVLRHALPNMAGPTFQVVAQSLAYLAGGVVVVESVFQFPGVGQAFVSSVQSRDLPVIQAFAMLLAAFYILVNLLADIGTVAMTPTMRGGAR